MSHSLRGLSSDSTTDENPTSTSSPTPPSLISVIKVTTNEGSPIISNLSDMGKMEYRKASFSLQMFSKHSSVMIEEFIDEDDELYFDNGKSITAMNNALDILKRISLSNKLKLDPVIGQIKISSVILEMSSGEEKEELETNNIKVKKYSSADELEENFIEIAHISALNAIINIVISDSVKEKADKCVLYSNETSSIPKYDITESKDVNTSAGIDNTDGQLSKLENEKERVDLYLNSISKFSKNKYEAERFQKMDKILITESELEFLLQLKEEEIFIEPDYNFDSIVSSQMEMPYYEYSPRKIHHDPIFNMPDILENTALDYGIGVNYLNYYKQEYCEGQERFSILLKRDEILQDIIKKQCYEVQDSLKFSHSFIRSIVLYRKKQTKQFTSCLKIYSPDKNTSRERNANPLNPRFTRMRPICLNSLTKCVVRDKIKNKSSNHVLSSNKSKSNKRFY